MYIAINISRFERCAQALFLKILMTLKFRKFSCISIKNFDPIVSKEVCNRAVTYQPALARNSRAQILAFWSKKTDMDSVNETFCFAPVVKMIRPKMLQFI